MITATWKEGFGSLHKADAQKVAEEIASIGDSATPEQILGKGCDPKSELHKCFTWNDGEAANKWRLHEARQIVCHLVIKQDKADEPEIRFFYRAAGGGYKPTVQIRRNENEYASLLQRAYSELMAFQVKYRALSELEPIFDEVDRLVKRPVADNSLRPSL